MFEGVLSPQIKVTGRKLSLAYGEARLCVRGSSTSQSCPSLSALKLGFSASGKGDGSRYRNIPAIAAHTFLSLVGKERN